VNGTTITSTDLELQLVLFRPELRENSEVRQRLLDQLIERVLIAEWLDQRQVEVDEDAVEARVELLQRVVEARGQSLDEVLARFGRTIESLREEQALPIRWSSYVGRVVTQDQIADYFTQHRMELDGTKVRLSHIVITVDGDAPISDWEDAEARLQSVHDDIASGSMTFEEAARNHSDSPTADEGGDIGFVNFRGDLATEVTRVAFGLEIGELSEPIQSPYGVHLIQVTDRQPGQLSLEDVRGKIIEQLGEQLWTSEVLRLSEMATIERLVDAPQP
jgi:parvulin-like peptidyl-prolyl isomerase